MIKVRTKGSFDKTLSYLKKVTKLNNLEILTKYGYEGVRALRDATPKRTGLTSESWTFEISETPTGYAIYWSNTNIQNGVNIALLIQNGHATGRGVYVNGIDYINPALEPIFTKIGTMAMMEVNKQ